MILKNYIIELLPDINPIGLQPEDSLKEIGASSVDRMDVIVGIQEILGVKVPMVEFAEAKNVQEIVDILYPYVSKV